MKFSYSEVWTDVVALARTHGTLIGAVAGVFIFLPALLIGYLLPTPEAAGFNQMLQRLQEYAGANWHWLLLQSLVAMVGTIAIFRLIFARAGITVGAAIAAAVALLPTYFAASVLSGLAIGIGSLLLIVPGLYLIGRLSPLGAVIVAEEQRNPITALSRTWDLTKGRGWAVLGLVLVVLLAALVVVGVLNALLGVIVILIAGRELGTLLMLIVSTATSTGMTVLSILLYAAIYRRLSPAQSAAAFD